VGAFLSFHLEIYLQKFLWFIVLTFCLAVVNPAEAAVWDHHLNAEETLACDAFASVRHKLITLHHEQNFKIIGAALSGVLATHVFAMERKAVPTLEKLNKVGRKALKVVGRLAKFGLTFAAMFFVHEVVDDATMAQHYRDNPVDFFSLDRVTACQFYFGESDSAVKLRALTLALDRDLSPELLDEMQIILSSHADISAR
jgi:hypothetical protein